MQNPEQHQPVLLRAIEQILAKPADIKRTVHREKERFQKSRNKPLNDTEFNDKLADKLIASYSTKAGLSGGATALIGIVPGVGTVVELFGGATADMALCLKYQVEMSMALATLYGHDIETEADRKRYFIIAGLSTINMEAIKQGGEQAARVFNKLVQRYLREATFDTVRILFRKVSITLSKKALQKAIPFGIGAAIGFTSNKTLTWMVGQRVKTYFATAE
jgi:uncharacterized protein (DUF697 family)